MVVVETGSERDAGAPSGSVSVNIVGDHGDTGMRPLLTSLSSGSSGLWRPKQKDIFIVEAVSVGKLEQVQLVFTGNKKGIANLRVISCYLHLFS